MGKMKVCMIAYSQYFRDARIKRYVKSIEEEGGEVDILALQENQRKRCDRIGNSRIFYLTTKYQGSNGFLYAWSYLGYFLACFFKVTSLYLKERYCTVHVHNMPNFIVFAAILPKLLGSKIILDVHDVMAANYAAKFSGRSGLMVKCLIFEQRVSALFASHVLCADHMQKEYLHTVCQIPAEKINVMLNLPDEKLFRPSKRREPDGLFRLIYHGTIAKRLGIDIILEAIAKIGDEIPVHLSIYGSGDFLPEAQTLSERLGLGKKVYFSGSFFPVEMVPEMVNGMDLGIIGNRKTSATDRFMMPVKLLEYVYLRKPVVAPRLKIIQSYFDEEMIRYYEPENVDELAGCIVDLYRNPGERESIVLKASKFYEKHSWEMQKKEYLKILCGNGKE